MQITDLLSRTGGLHSIARQLGVDDTQVASAADALLPAILGGLRKQAQPGPTGDAGLAGSGSLGDLLGRLGAGNLLDDAAERINGNRHTRLCRALGSEHRAILARCQNPPIDPTLCL